MISRVFFFEPTDQPIDASWRWGSPEYLFHSGESRPSIFDPAIIPEIVEKLVDSAFCPALDYIALTGNFNAVNLLVGAALTEYSIVRVLQYDVKDRNYSMQQFRRR